uniref:Nuclear receptor domain-containing protein n=1 Tax=Steinernema glaseri TaxID=37863 RepID=A0A1I7Y0S9_9BILA
MPVCEACYNRCAVGKNFGAETCASCAAFFRRSVRLQVVYQCKKDQHACSKDAVRSVSAIHACRKCRMDRCLSLGMNPELVQAPRPSGEKLALQLPTDIGSPPHEEFPLISAMVRALRMVFERHQPITSDPRRIVGTSEYGENNLTSEGYKRLALGEHWNFRNMLEHVPVVCELDPDFKDAIFKNSFVLYTVFIRTYYNTRHWSCGFNNTRRFYFMPNVYFDLDPEKLIFMFAQKNGRVTLGDCRNISRQLASNLQFLHDISLQSREFYATYEDMAILLLLVIVQSNDFDKPNIEWQRPIRCLKAVWKELDLFYRKNLRDPSHWGNLLFLLSNYQTAQSNHRTIRSLLAIYFEKTMAERLQEQNNRPQETMRTLWKERNATKVVSHISLFCSHKRIFTFENPFLQTKGGGGGGAAYPPPPHPPAPPPQGAGGGGGGGASQPPPQAGGGGAQWHGGGGGGGLKWDS